MTRTAQFTAFAALLFCSSPIFSQSVQLRGYGEADLHGVIRTALAPGTILLTRDTFITPDDTLNASVLVLGARLILEGTILGDLTGIQANIYLRPRSVVTGQVTNITGGVYPSELARTGGIDDRALAPYRLIRDGTNYIIEGTVELPDLKLIGGAAIPEYNRVDGLRVELGPSILLPPMLGVDPVVSGSIGYATEREEVLGRAQLLLRHGRSSLAFGWEDDITITSDDWIRSSLKNSLSFIWNGKDYRDYYEVDRVYLEFRRVLERGARTSQYWIRGQNERSESLATGDPFVIWKPDAPRPNLAVPSLRVASLLLGAQTEWTGTTTVWEVAAQIETAGKVIDADVAFNAYRASVEYAMRAIANHTLYILANFRGPLPGTDDLPLQRWTFVGGSGTLYTFPIAAFRGDRLSFVETEYRVPFHRDIRLPVLGRPTLRLMHNIGMAWSRAADRDFEQNIGIRLQFPLAFVRFVTNPADFSDHAEFSFGLSTPSPGYPWEKASRRRGS